MAKIETYPLTNEMMQEAQEIIDECCAERFKYPEICPKCGSNNLRAWVPNPEYVAFKLVDGEWEYREEDSYEGDYNDWDNAYYRCDDCNTKFRPTNENG